MHDLLLLLGRLLGLGLLLRHLRGLLAIDMLLRGSGWLLMMLLRRYAS